MNKKFLFHIFTLCGAFISIFAVLVSSATAAPTRFLSPNYGVESIIFGGTGVLRSSEASIPPVITAGPVVSVITTTNATLSWKTDKVSNSIVFFGTVSGTYPVQTGQVVEAIYTDHVVTLNSLGKSTLYFYKVRSADAVGNFTESKEGSFTTDPGDIIPPKLTSGPTIASTSASSIVVTWETDKVSTSTVEYGRAAVTDNAVGSQDALTVFHQVTVNGLQALTTYHIRVKSRDSSGNLYTSPAQDFTTPDSPSITDVKITDVTLNSAVVQWKTTSPNTSVINYGTKSAAYDAVAQDLSSYSQNHIIRLSNLASGTVFYLKISGLDAAGNRLSSDQYTFRTVVLPLITDFRVSDVTSNGAALHWHSSSDIDEFARYSVVKGPNVKVIGKGFTAGNDKLVSDHTILLDSLDAGTDYSVAVSGKDVFGNQALSSTLTFSTLVDSDAPIIENIKSDTTVDLGSKQSVQVLVSFGISELATARIEFGQGATGEYTNSVDTDTELSRSKLLVLSGLTAGQSYHFHIIVKDPEGNTAKSADYLVLAPTQPISLFDLIFKQLRDNFGSFATSGG
jgi:hypothetical protein